jgi:alkaline phosphatase D
MRAERPRVAERPRFARYPFTLGVASGSPLPTAVVLWTRLAPKPLHGGGLGSLAFPVDWEVAHDEGFRQVARRGRVNAVPALGHSVHVDVRGLEPGRSYFYRFRAGDTVSPIGRTRTAPDPQTSPERLRYGFASCQHFEVGYFAAYRHLLAEDLDLMVFLGDYIYEGPGRDGRVRRHTDGEARTLVQYRNRQAQYKTDPDLQRLHAAVPWLITWDDHEVDNDYADGRSESLGPRFLRRRAAAYQAYFEHMPLRAMPRPGFSAMRVYRRYDWGRLARFHVLDGRQYRTPQACPPPGRGGANSVYEDDCPDLVAAGRTMLGAPQMRWLRTGLAAAPDRWHLIAQQTLMARAGVDVNGRRRVWTDAWDGYPAARRRLLRFLRDRGLRSCVVLTGDAHVSYVCDLKPDFDDLQAEPVATELCGTSVTSPGRPQSEVEAVMRDNPHIRFGDSRRRGYVVVDVTAERSIARLRVLDDVTDPATGVATQATFAIDAGRPGAQQIMEQDPRSP